MSNSGVEDVHVPEAWCQLPDPATELKVLVEKQQRLQQELDNMERQIHQFEGNYLADTASSGNLVRGWRGLLVNLFQSESSTEPGYRVFRDSERVFSRSSATSAFAATFTKEKQRQALKFCWEPDKILG